MFWRKKEPLYCSATISDLLEVGKQYSKKEKFTLQNNDMTLTYASPKILVHGKTTPHYDLTEELFTTQPIFSAKTHSGAAIIGDCDFFFKELNKHAWLGKTLPGNNIFDMVVALSLHRWDTVSLYMMCSQDTPNGQYMMHYDVHKLTLTYEFTPKEDSSLDATIAKVLEAQYTTPLQNSHWTLGKGRKQRTIIAGNAPNDIDTVLKRKKQALKASLRRSKP